MLQCLDCDSYEIREEITYTADGPGGPILESADCGSRTIAEEPGPRHAPMISLKSIMDAGPAMRIRTADYADPERVWL
jgi:hypothetical protein